MKCKKAVVIKQPLNMRLGTALFSKFCDNFNKWHGLNLAETNFEVKHLIKIKVAENSYYGYSFNGNHSDRRLIYTKVGNLIVDQLQSLNPPQTNL